MEAEIEKRILKELSEIKKELKIMKKQLMDLDIFLTEEEHKLVNESIKHEKEGKLITLDSVLKKLGVEDV